MTESKEIKSKIENLKTESLWSDLEKENLTEKTYLLDYDVDLVEVALAMVENNERQIKSLIADGLLYPPTKEEINSFLDHETLLNVIKLDSHTLVQQKTRE